MSKKARKKIHEARQAERELLLNQRRSKMAAAKFSYECARFYHECDNVAGVTYWEYELKRNLAEAKAIGRPLYGN